MYRPGHQTLETLCMALLWMERWFWSTPNQTFQSTPNCNISEQIASGCNKSQKTYYSNYNAQLTTTTTQHTV